MSVETGFRRAALGAAVLAIVAGAGCTREARPGDACSAPVGVCQDASLPACGLRLGDWQVTRARAAGLPDGRSHSTCVRRTGAADDPRAAVASVAPQPVSVSGDTLVAREPAPRADAQRATVRLDVVGSLPDHWAFAIAGTFLDAGTPHGCAGLAIQPPVNAGYALIGANWQSRPHGFYFERLADACVYDGKNPACPGEHGFVAHEFQAGESFALDLALRTDGGEHWLEAEIAAPSPASPGDASGARRVLGRMRQRVDAPCWLPDGEAGSALLVVIPHPDPATQTPESRVDVSRFAWLDAGAPR